MAYNNFEEVQQAINLINASLKTSVWSRDDLKITDDPNFRRNGLAVEKDGDDYNFYLSSNVSGDWEWIQISSTSGTTSGGTKTHIVGTIVELNSIVGVDEGSFGIVTESYDLFCYLDNNWVQLTNKEPKDYYVVESIVERDEIPINKRKEGLTAFVSSLRTEYRLEADLVTWYVISYGLNDDITLEEESWYVSPDGDDVNGDGMTPPTAWKTLEKCLVTIPRIRNHPTNIYLLAGSLNEYTFTFTPHINELMGRLYINKAFRFHGDLELVTEDYTATGPHKENMPTSRPLDGGEEFDNDNQYLGYFFRNSADRYLPIGPHKKDEIVTTESIHSSNVYNRGIYKCKTNIEINDFFPPLNNSFVNIVFFNTIVLLNRGNQNTLTNLQFSNSIIKLKKNETISCVGSVLKCNVTLILSENTNVPTISISNRGVLETEKVMIYNISPNTSTSCAIELENYDMLTGSILIEGFAYAISNKQSSTLGHNNSYNAIVVNNCGSLFQIKGAGFQLNKSSNNVSSLPHPRMFLNDINYLFALNAGVGTTLNNININLGDGYLQNELNVIQPFVASDSRLWQGGNNLTNVALTPKPKNLIDIERNINIVFPNSFGNIENMDYMIDWGVGGDEILIGNTTINKSIKIDYTATTDDDIEIGSVYLTNKEDIDIETGEYSIYRETVFDDIGLVFKKEIDGNDINLIIENTRDDEEPITLEMDIRRYQI